MVYRFCSFIFFSLVVSLMVSCASTISDTPSSSKTTIPTNLEIPTIVRPNPSLTVVPSQVPGRLVNGPVVGAVTFNSATVFVQTDQSAWVQLKYWKSNNLTKTYVSDPIKTEQRTGFTTQIKITDLEPNARYSLDVLVNGSTQFNTPYPTFKVFPRETEDADFSFAILTDFFWRPSATFRNVAAENPDFVVIGGDFSHTNPTTIEQKRRLFMSRYDRNGKVPDFVNFVLDRFPVMHFWDDHDFGKNNADKTYPYKRESLQVLQEFFPVYPLSTHGDWQKFSYGNADFFLLDARSQRDPSTDLDDASKSLLDGDELGAEGQYIWLTASLLESQARWKFVFTPVPFNPTVGKNDSWASYQTEQKRLVKFIKDNNIGGIIFISGDLHAGAIDDGSNSMFPEMVVPSPNGNSCMTTPNSGQWSEGVYSAPPGEGCMGYGLVRVTIVPDQVELSVKSDVGAPVLKLNVGPLSQKAK